jgi:hypothetical protein
MLSSLAVGPTWTPPLACSHPSSCVRPTPPPLSNTHASALVCVDATQVDVGAEFDGLIPVRELEGWEETGGALDVGNAVEVRIYKLRTPVDLFRCVCWGGGGM